MRYEIGQMVRIKDHTMPFGIITEIISLYNRNDYIYKVVFEDSSQGLFYRSEIEIYIPFNVNVEHLKVNIQKIFTQHGYQPQYQFWSKWWKKLSLK